MDMDKFDRNFTLEEIVEYVNLNFPDHMLVEISDYEAPNKETYKYLYEKTLAELQETQESLFHMQIDYQNLEKDFENQNLNSEAASLRKFIHKYLNEEIVVSDIKAVDSDNNEITSSVVHISDPDSLSSNPGVYGFKRPSWFTPLKKELNKKNMAEKNIEHSKGFLISQLQLLKNIKSFLNGHNGSLSKMADSVDDERKKNLVKILLGTNSNQEKYLKYILITPGMSKEFQDILFNAADLGLDANVVIELLEQPKESFNKEVIISYVSEIRKGTEYNLKKELADELIRGDWYITASINGKTEKFQLVPIDEIKDIQKKLDSIYNTLSNTENENFGSSVSGESPETPEQEFQDEKNYPFIYENENIESSSMINFDESMI